MKVKGKSEGYSVFLEVGETIKILVDGNEIYTYTVPENKNTNIGYTLSEVEKPTEE